MTTTLDVTTLAPYTRRLLLVSCAADPAGPMSLDQKAKLWKRLGDRAWTPTPTTSPLPYADLQTWYDGLQGQVQRFVQEEIVQIQEETTVEEAHA